jgi:hypothetical protein
MFTGRSFHCLPASFTRPYVTLEHRLRTYAIQEKICGQRLLVSPEDRLTSHQGPLGPTRNRRPNMSIRHNVARKRTSLILVFSISSLPTAASYHLAKVEAIYRFNSLPAIPKLTSRERKEYHATKVRTTRSWDNNIVLVTFKFRLKFSS